jgi:hypothetical protein
VLCEDGQVLIANASLPNFSMKEMFNAIERAPAQHSLCHVIHNIDAPVFRTSTAKASLSLLASNPRVRLVVFIDRINAPLLWQAERRRAAAMFGYGTT